MNSFVINGGKSLKGEVVVSGSKNAALPLIFSCIALGGVSTLSNVPDIGDVRVALELVSDFGAEITRSGSTVVIDTRNLRYTEPREELVKKIRASTYLLGAMLARFGKAKIYNFGGCNFEPRPIDMHLYAIEALGGVIDGDMITANELIGADIRFKKASVGATINALLLASSAKGVTRIYGYAREPHVLSLMRFLSTAGVKLKRCSGFLEIEGDAFTGGRASVIPDMIEGGTYIAASLMTESPVLIRGVDAHHLASLLKILSDAGAHFSINEEGIIPYGKITKPISLTTAPYPGFPTDLQPQMAPLLAVACGGVLTEGVWHGRFGYLSELSKFGVLYEQNEDSAVISKSDLKCAAANSCDLRGGAALILSAIFASGESEIKSAEIIKRGYENIVEKLGSLGVDIKERNT